VPIERNKSCDSFNGKVVDDIAVDSSLKAAAP
jgi:hypothetical protein